MAESKRQFTQQEIDRMLYMQGLQPRSTSDIVQSNLASQTIKPIPQNVFQKMAGGAGIAKEAVNKLGNASDLARLFPGYQGKSNVNIPTGYNFAMKQDPMGGVIPGGLQTQQVNVDQLLKAIKPADVLGITGAQQAYSDVGMGRAPNPMDVLDVAGLGATGLGAGKGLLSAAKATKGLPVGMSIKDVSKTGLPSPQSLTMPDVPTVEQMKQFGRTEIVPLSKAVSFQGARNWEKFNSGKSPGDLVAGFGDKPLALRLETGEYVIYDGNHRTDLALQKGKTELPMHVIDVKSYDPSNAGRKPVQPSMSDDELLSSLLGTAETGIKDVSDDTLRIYRGSSEPSDIYTIDPNHTEDIYGGVFGSPEKKVAEGHGTVGLHYTDIPQKEILTDYDLKYEIPFNEVKNALIKSFPKIKKASDEDLEIIFDTVVYDVGQDLRNLDDDQLNKLYYYFNHSNDLDNDVQRARGKLSNNLGYKAVEMFDETGSSYLISPGATFKKNED